MEQEVINQFLKKFNFDPQKSLFVGVERESFTMCKNKILPIVPEILPLIEKMNPSFQSFGYELSACQLEIRYGPYHLSKVEQGLISATDELSIVEGDLDFKCYFSDVANQDISLNIYPDPTGRYAKIASLLSKEVLHAACYIAGTHVHIGMPNAETALRVYNKVCSHSNELMEFGDNSNGERMKYYSLVSNNIYPTKYDSMESWVQDSLNRGYFEDPRKNWSLIRISVHGTIEFRMFGSTPNISKIFEYVKQCHDLCFNYF